MTDEIRAQWRTWTGARSRTGRHRAANNLFPPDQRFSVTWPPGMCVAHRLLWLSQRDQRFDPVTGNRWPGTAGSPFTPIGADLTRVREERRLEWDDKASAQTRQT